MSTTVARVDDYYVDNLFKRARARASVDDDETGTISFRNLKRVAKKLGENMTDGGAQG